MSDLPEIIVGIVAGLAFLFMMCLILGLVVMWLWNWLIPDIFGLQQINYWQGFGLLLLSSLLFKSHKK